jgi:hypothetical protein
VWCDTRHFSTKKSRAIIESCLIFFCDVNQYVLSIAPAHPSTIIEQTTNWIRQYFSEFCGFHYYWVLLRRARLLILSNRLNSVNYYIKWLKKTGCAWFLVVVCGPCLIAAILILICIIRRWRARNLGVLPQCQYSFPVSVLMRLDHFTFPKDRESRSITSARLSK